MDWQVAIKQTEASLLQLGWKVMGAAAVLLAGLLLASGVRRVLRRILWRRFEPSRRSAFFPDVVWLALLALSFVLALVVLGVGGPVIGVIVSVGLALGLFADSLSGLRMLGSRVFRIGDTIEIIDKNIIGELIDISLIGTTLLTDDGSRILIPNQMIFNNPVRRRDSSRELISLQFVVKPRTDIDDLQKMILEMIASTGDRDNSSNGEILVTRIEQDAVTVKVRFATEPHRRAGVASEFLKKASIEFERNSVQVRSLALIEEGAQAKKG